MSSSLSAWQHSPATASAVIHHPLMPAKTTSLFRHKATQQPEVREEKKADKPEFFDPLGAAENADSPDEPPPLVAAPLLPAPDENRKKSVSLANTLESSPSHAFILTPDLPDCRPWPLLRQEILSEFTTGDRLALSSSFLSTQAARITVTDRTAHRLELLSDMSGLKKLADLSQKEYVSHVNELRELLLVAWNNNKRVEAVKLVTELARSLSTTPVPQFYPSQWVLVTDVLDLFGRLVYERLLGKANQERQRAGQSPLPLAFTSEDVLSETADTARNWFLKIADIKELLPRFYVETALIAVMRFLDSSALRVNLLRLTSMAAKMPFPVATAYARAYVCKIAMCVEPADRAPHWRALHEWMQGEVLPEQIPLTWPAAQWIVQCVGYGAHSREDLAPLWEYARMEGRSALILPALVNGLPARYVTDHAAELMQLVVRSPSALPHSLSSLGARLSSEEGARVDEETRRALLRTACVAAMKMASLPAFLSCVSVWCGFASRFFGVDELAAICEAVRRRADGPGADKLPCLERTLCDMVGSMCEWRAADVEQLILHPAFAGVMDLIRDEPFSSTAASHVLTAVVRGVRMGGSGNFVMAYQVIDVSARLCSLSGDSPSEQTRASNGRLVLAALQRFDLCSDPERCLEWLVRARAELRGAEGVLEFVLSSLTVLGQRVCCLGRASARRAAFTRAVLANLHVTIPSVRRLDARMRAAVKAVELGVAANSMPQTDALLRLSLECLLEVPAESFRCHLCSLLAVLLHVADSPDREPLHNCNGVMNVLERRSDLPPSTRALCWVDVLHVLSAADRVDYGTRIGGTAGNDVLYGGSEEFRSALRAKASLALSAARPLCLADPPAACALLEHVVTWREGYEEGELSSLIPELLSSAGRSRQLEKRVGEVKRDMEKVGMRV